MVSTVLLDVNVLIALAWSEHTHHAIATHWMRSEPRHWATCPLTECGFLRIGSNTRITPGATTPGVAHEALVRLRGRPRHCFWPDDYSPAEEPSLARLQGHNQITDAYLLLLAHRHKGQIATFDAALKVLAQELLGNAQRVLLIPH